jgi:hypothetical protein
MDKVWEKNYHVFVARRPNTAETVQITISTTPIVRGLLEALVEHGTYGKNVAEASERLLTERLNEIMGKNGLEQKLISVHEKLISNSSHINS